MGQATRTTKLLLDLGKRRQGGANTGKRAALDATVEVLNEARGFYIDFLLAHADKLSEHIPYHSEKHLEVRVRAISANELLTWAEACTVQIIRAAILQLLLGNRRCKSTLIHRGKNSAGGRNPPAYMRSLLQACYGNRCYRHIPKITGDHSHLAISYLMLGGKVKGYLLFGQNPAAGSTHATMQRKALEQLDWMVVRDLYEVESAAFWYRGPGYGPETEAVDASTIKMEIFLMPVAASTEKEGSFTNTQRLLQWRDKAVDPPGDARSDLCFVYHLGRRLKDLYADSKEERDRGLQTLRWDYEMEEPEEGSRITDEPDALLVLKEINGYYTLAGSNVGLMHAKRLGRLNSRTGSMASWIPPGAQYGIMTTTVDAAGDAWFTEQNANYIGRFDPRLHTFRIFPLGT